MTRMSGESQPVVSSCAKVTAEEKFNHERNRKLLGAQGDFTKEQFNDLKVAMLEASDVFTLDKL